MTFKMSPVVLLESYSQDIRKNIIHTKVGCEPYALKQHLKFLGRLPTFLMISLVVCAPRYN